MRAVRAATQGGSEPPNCRLQIADCRFAIADAAPGSGGQPKLINPERAMKSAGNREAEILTADYADEHGSGIRGKCSPMFAYVRLIREKMLLGLRTAVTGHGEMREMMDRRSRCGNGRRSSRIRRIKVN